MNAVEVREETPQPIARKMLRATQRGMTLIEIMVVMAIIGLIGTVVAVSVSGSQGDAELLSTRTLVKTTVAGSVQMFQATRREYPESLEALVELRRLKKDQLVDAWNKPLVYSVNDTGFTVCSGGPDKVAGNSDDICFDSSQE